jgi:UDP-GlcNAc:undecaprenyl-phosphate GlcNAc-1-phosphate transferase
MAAALEFLPRLLVIGGVGLGFFLVGLLDDKKALSVKARFLLEFLLAGTLVAAGVRFDLGFLPKPVGMAFTVVWIVGIANAFNLLDGLDGLVGGVTVICSCILAVVLVQGNQPMVAMYAAALAGSSAGFLRHNFHPASIFMGSSGSLFLGYTLGVSVVLASFVIEGSSAVFPILMPLLLLAVPLYDTASVVLIRFRERRPLFGSDRSHTHHRLLAAGFSERSAVLFIWLLTLMVGISSVLLVSAQLWTSIMIFLQVALAFALIILVKHVRLKNPVEEEHEGK